MDRAYTFDWRRKEHVRITELLVRETLKRSPWRQLRVLVWAVVVLALAFASPGVASGDTALVFPLVPLALAVAVLTLASPRLTAWLQAYQVGRTDPNTGDPITFQFVDSGLRIHMRTVDAELRWSGVPRVRETPDFFLIYYSRSRAYFLPKRVIPTADEVLELALWIRDKLASEAEYVHDSGP